MVSTLSADFPATSLLWGWLSQAPSPAPDDSCSSPSGSDRSAYNVDAPEFVPSAQTSPTQFGTPAYWNSFASAGGSTCGLCMSRPAAQGWVFCAGGGLEPSTLDVCGQCVGLGMRCVKKWMCG